MYNTKFKVDPAWHPNLSRLFGLGVTAAVNIVWQLGSPIKRLSLSDEWNNHGLRPYNNYG